MYSTFLGGTDAMWPTDSLLDKDAGRCLYRGFYHLDQIFPNESDRGWEHAGGFVTELNSSGNALVYSTYLGVATTTSRTRSRLSTGQRLCHRGHQ